LGEMNFYPVNCAPNFSFFGKVSFLLTFKNFPYVKINAKSFTNYNEEGFARAFRNG